MAEQTPDRWVEYVPVDDIGRAARNPKLHDEQAITTGITELGLVDLPVLDDRTGRLVSGHGRLDDIRRRRDAGQPPPGGVTAGTDGVWRMAVTRGWSSRDDAHADAAVVLMNNAVMLGGWDDTQLGALLSDLNDQDAALLELTGFTDEDLAALLATDDEDDDLGEGDGDSPPPPATNPFTKPGDVWLLGHHRVLCGDATDAAAVEEMLAGERADCMWTDPPYGVDYVGGYHGKTPAERRATGGKEIHNDGAGGLPELLDGAFAVATLALRPGAPVYVAHPSRPPLAREFVEAFGRAGWLLRQGLVWVKDSLVLGQSDYHYQHEPIAYGFTAGGEGRLGRGGKFWYGDDAQVSVFEVPKPPRNDVHPTMKPVALIRQHLTNSAPRGGLVYDPFAGSGSTLIACHDTGRRAALVELDPAYVDVICARYQQLTGEQPILEATGVGHDFATSEPATS